MSQRLFTPPFRETWLRGCSLGSGTNEFNFLAVLTVVAGLLQNLLAACATAETLAYSSRYRILNPEP